MVRESYIDSELFHLFRNLQDQAININGLTIKDIKLHHPIDHRGEADIYLKLSHQGKEIAIIIETKRKKAGDRFDPYSPRVIGQALGYAKYIAAPFIITSNGDLFLCFDISVDLPILQCIVNENIKLEFSEQFIHQFLEELEAYLTQKKYLKKLSARFIERLAYFHQLITPFFRKELRNRLKDTQYKNRFVKFCDKRGYVYREVAELVRWIGEQSAYLLLNRVLFYNVLQRYYPNIPKIPLINGITVKMFITKLNQTFQEVMNKINYQIIFRKANIFDEIPISDELAYLLNEFIGEIATFDVSLINEDIIGKVYEQIIPEIDKHLRGQYYTPSWIADVISELTIEKGSDKILDTSCGSGTFLISAYNKLSEFPGNTHDKIIDQLTGVDINYFPAHLAAFNLIIRDITHRHDNLKILPLDFFHIHAGGQRRLDTLNYLSLSDEDLDDREDLALPNFNVVITNPPYTEAREIGDKKYKKDIRKVALGRKTKISKSLGIYAYFYTHATHFLTKKGRIGFIVSNSFLETRGGKTLRQFFLDNFKIKYMIGFVKNVFEHADVKAIITILEKCGSKTGRSANTVKFVKVLTDFNVLDKETFITAIESSTENEKTPDYSIIHVPQTTLAANPFWMIYFRPFEQIDLFLQIFSTNFQTLTDFCGADNIRSCFKAGGYSFFMLTEEQNKTLQIESSYLKPIIHTPRDFSKIGITATDIKKSLFVIPDITQLKQTQTNAKQYLDIWMKKKITLKKGKLKGRIVEGIQNTPSFKGNKDWYKVAKGQIRGNLLFQGYVNRDVRCFVNLCGAYSAANYVTIKIPDSKYIPVLALIYNSSLMQFYLELTGTVLGANALYIANYLLSTTPIPRLTQLTADQLEEAQAIYENFITQPFDTPQFNQAKDRLDAYVFDLYHVSPKQRTQLQRVLSECITTRLSG